MTEGKERLASGKWDAVSVTVCCIDIGFSQLSISGMSPVLCNTDIRKNEGRLGLPSLWPVFGNGAGPPVRLCGKWEYRADAP